MLDSAFVYVKYTFSFVKNFVMYSYYGIKQRLRAFFNGDLSLFAFIKSLLKVPFEAYVFTRIHIRSGL